jgi:hypothetical protein
VNPKYKATQHPSSNDESNTPLDGLVTNLSNGMTRVGTVFKQLFNSQGPTKEFESSLEDRLPAIKAAAVALPLVTPPSAPATTSKRNIPATANALHWCVTEMERRYRLMSMLGVRNLTGFNQKICEAEAAGRTIYDPDPLVPESPIPLSTLPFIVVVVDEFADLMMVAGKKVEELIARLAQKARAAGIHLILATQRPSVDVISGLADADIRRDIFLEEIEMVAADLLGQKT